MWLLHMLGREAMRGPWIDGNLLHFDVGLPLQGACTHG